MRRSHAGGVVPVGVLARVRGGTQRPAGVSVPAALAPVRDRRARL